MKEIQTLRLIGLMSGSSLDGVDLACCRFELHPEKNGKPVRNWELEIAETIPYPGAWQDRLRQLPSSDAATLCKADTALGHYLGRMVKDFINRHALQPDAIASHGHTIFHFPEEATTVQIGAGAAIAAETGLTTIDNFRAMDLALGGQGAPLAPIADLYLFPEFDCWLNLGGIANITVRREDRQLIAFDIGGANQVLNALVAPLGLTYDQDGRLAATGKLIPELLKKADALPYFQKKCPKSLGNDWVQDTLLPIFLTAEGATADKLYTACLHLARQIARSVEQTLPETARQKHARMLATGGGALNTFLMGLIQEECAKICSLEVVVPEPDIVQFKEATLMALMGALRLTGRPNCLSSVTGARANAMSGSVHTPPAEV
jgi:anhydro-N-acetylmuramic acid kinase